jgi:hypothetical protein
MLLVLLLWLFNPLCPGSWSEITPGMTEQEVATMVRSTFNTPEALELRYMWETKKESWYSWGTYRRFCGREWTLIVTYDATGHDAGFQRHVISTRITGKRIPLWSYLKDFTQWDRVVILE